MKMNPLTQMDFYKADHRRQYPEGTQFVYSNFTPRSSRLAPVLHGYYDEKVVFVGLQGFIKEFLIETFNDGFFDRPKEEVVAEYKRRMDTSLGEGAVPVDHIEALHDLGYLPICIKALPEGSRVDIKVPVLTVRNTNKHFSWLVNYLETVMSAMLWKPCTTATVAYEYRRILEHYAEATGSPLDFVAVQAHDFSFRGMSGLEDAARSGIGHLLSFVGTDTVPAIDYAENYYNADAGKELIGCSVPATEHSVMCMGGNEDEIETFRRLIEDLYPTGIVSIVSDTWDFWKVITEYTITLKDKIMARKPNAIGLNKVVFRPDSGDPVKILTGYTSSEYATIRDPKTGEEVYICRTTGKMLDVAEVKGAVECLWDIFGGTLTPKDFKVLDEHVGLIYGDSITLQRANDILQRLEDKGFASCNVVFGVGSYTYNYLTRDSFGFAMKATYGVVNDEGRELFKDPITDSGTKKSAKGLLRVEKEGDDFVLYDQQTLDQEEEGLLQEVFFDGELIRDESLSDIRSRLM